MPATRRPISLLAVNPSAVTESVRAIISESTAVSDVPTIGEHDRLRDSGLDSMGIVSMIVAIEETYQVVFPDEMLSWDALGTIASISAIIAQLISASHEAVPEKAAE